MIRYQAKSQEPFELIRWVGRVQGVFLIMALTGCGSGSTSSTASLSTAATAVNNAKSQLLNLATPPGGAVSSVSLKTLGLRQTLFGAFSVDDNVSDYNNNRSLVLDPRTTGGSGCSNSSTGLKTRMQVELSPSVTGCDGTPANGLGKLANRLNRVCAMANALSISQSSDLPTSGSLTLNASDLISSAKSCGMDTTQFQPTSATITYGVPNNTSVYDRLLTLSVALSDGTQNETVAFKLTGSGVKLADMGTAERVVVDYDYSTGVARGEYISGPQGDFRGHSFMRFYYDSKNDLGRVLSDYADYSAVSGGSMTKEFVYVASSKPKMANQSLGLSLDFFGYGVSGTGGAFNSSGSFAVSGCVNLSSGALTKATAYSNVFTCDNVYAKAYSAYVSGVYFNPSKIHALTAGTDWNVISAANTPSMNWNMDGMLSTDF